MMIQTKKNKSTDEQVDCDCDDIDLEEIGNLNTKKDPSERSSLRLSESNDITLVLKENIGEQAYKWQ